MIETKKKVEFDEIDKKIIEIYSENSKTTLNEIKHTIGSSISTIYNRIQKLTENGVIEGYTILKFEKALLDPLNLLTEIYDEVFELIDEKDNYTLKGFIRELENVIIQIPKYIAKRGLDNV